MIHQTNNGTSSKYLEMIAMLDWSYSPSEKLLGEWVLPLGAVISKIIWVDKLSYDWSMNLKVTINQS